MDDWDWVNELNEDEFFQQMMNTLDQQWWAELDNRLQQEEMSNDQHE